MIAAASGFTLYGRTRHLAPDFGHDTQAYCGVRIVRDLAWVEPDERPYSDECGRCQRIEREMEAKSWP